MIVTISGHPGSGKTSVGRILAKKLGYDFVSIGDLRGEMALEKGLTISQLNKIGETEDWTDRLADEKLKQLAKKGNTVFDSRMGFFLIRSAVNIFLEVSFKEGAKRIMGSKRKDELIGRTVEEQTKFMKEIIQSDRTRYKKYYNIIYDDKNNFDFWLDTSGISKDKVVEKILEFLKNYSNRETT